MRFVLASIALALVCSAPIASAGPNDIPSRCVSWGKQTLQCGVQRIDVPLATALAAKKSWSVSLTFESTATDADLATISQVPWITEVRIESKLVTSVQPLTALTNLQKLELRAPKVTTAAPLSAMTTLRYVDLMGSSVTDVAPFANSKNLERLGAFVKGLDLKPLAGHTSLRELWLSDIADWTALKGLTGLETIVVRGGTFTELSFLANATRMRRLDIFVTKSLNTIAAIKGMTELRELHIGGSAVSDISVLSGLPKLAILGLDNTLVTSVAPLAKTTTLERVDLTGTKIKDLTPLLASKNSLQQLQVPDDTPDSALEPFRKANPKIWFHDTY